MAESRALVLFDIDGTLVRRAGPHHRRALERAVRRVAGLDVSLDQVDCSGRLDGDLIRELLLAGGGAEAGARQIQLVADAAERIYVRSCPPIEDKLCPGVRAVLERLRRERVALALVTGNLPRIAWKKMRQAGIAEFFDFGAFAGQAETRAELAAMAIEQARRSHVVPDDCRISLIGDHPNDVQAAKMNGIQSIAVATGVSSREDLAACEPDWLLSDLRDLRLRMIL